MNIDMERGHFAKTDEMFFLKHSDLALVELLQPLC